MPERTESVGVAEPEADLGKVRDERRAVEEKMYWARHDGTSDAQRQQLEQKWNELKSKEAAAEGNEWKYRHDRRDDFTFEKQTNRRGVEGVTARGQVHDPDTTINWRAHTEIGANREKAIHPHISRGTGDHAGHLVPAQFGADPEGVNRGGVDPKRPNAVKPEDRLNYDRQHGGMNQGKGWHDVEQRVADNAREREASGKPLAELSVQTFRASHRDNGERGFYRTMSLRDENGQSETIGSDRYVAGNFSSPSKRDADEKRGIGTERPLFNGEGGKEDVVSIDEARTRKRTR